jgi:exopolyphosphatase
MSPPKNAFTPLYVPITNIPASDIQLRPEYLAVFKHANIEPGHLITLDDLPPLSDIRHKLAPENTKWILVDHNALQGELGTIYYEQVAGVIDHHDEEGKVRKDTGDEPRIIEKSGSCTSLIANYCRPMWDELPEAALSSGAAHAQGESLSDDSAVKRWDAAAAQLGLASILIDTANLRDENKTTEHDRKAVAYLEAKITTCPQLSTTFDRTTFYEEIDAAKRDIGALKLQDILRKDYKQWDQSNLKLGISSVVKNIDFLMKKAGDEASAQSASNAILGAIDQFSKERELDLYTLMTTSTSSAGEFQREVLLWAFTERGTSAAKTFATKSSDELGLEDWCEIPNLSDASCNEGQWRKIWWQRQVQHSRKRVAPLLRDAMA